MTNRFRIRPSSLFDERTIKLLTVLGAVVLACTAISSALHALLAARQLQLISLQRKTLPVLRQAAQLYLDQNAPETTSATRRKLFLFPRKKAADPVPEDDEAAEEAIDEIPF